MAERNSHPEFSAPDADVLVRSSDDVVFHLHRTNIITHTNVFPLQSSVSVDKSPEIAEFSEDSSVLAVLFKFLYNDTLPDVSELPFPTLELVAYASHKYQIVSAMAVCDVVLRLFVETHPLEVLKYYVSHELSKSVIDKAARHTLDVSPSEAAAILGAVIFVRWAIYRDKWFLPDSGNFWKALKVTMPPPNTPKKIIVRAIKDGALSVKEEGGAIVTIVTTGFNFTVPAF